jgi:hypothetical protein
VDNSDFIVDKLKENVDKLKENVDKLKKHSEYLRYVTLPHPR